MCHQTHQKKKTGINSSTQICLRVDFFFFTASVLKANIDTPLMKLVMGPLLSSPIWLIVEVLLLRYPHTHICSHADTLPTQWDQQTCDRQAVKAQQPALLTRSQLALMRTAMCSLSVNEENFIF